MDLMERRRALAAETEDLEARRGLSERPLPSVPIEDDGSGDRGDDAEEAQEEEDLIDMVSGERRESASAPESGQTAPSATPEGTTTSV